MSLSAWTAFAWRRIGQPAQSSDWPCCVTQITLADTRRRLNLPRLRKKKSYIHSHEEQGGWPLLVHGASLPKLDT